jgi:hypothetical protein
MAKDPKPYFALAEPMPDTHILTILGRVVPVEQTKKPLGTLLCPPLPPHSQISQRNAAEEAPSKDSNLLTDKTEESSIHGSSSQRPSGHISNINTHPQPEIHDHESAVTQVGSLHYRDHSVDNPVQQKDPEAGFDLCELDGVDLYPEKAVECRNLEYLKTRAKDAKALLEVEKMLSMYTSHNRESKEQITAQGFRRIEIETPHIKVRQMLKDKRYAEAVIAFLKKQRKQEAAIVVSILTVSDMTKQRTEHRERKSGIKAQLPGPKEGNPAPIPKLEASVENTSFTHEELTGSYEGEVIVAIRYLKLKLHPPVQRTLWYKINYMLRKWTNKLPNQNEDIYVSEDFLGKSDGTLSLSSKEIPGTAPALLGDNPVRRLTRRETPMTMGDEDSNFTIVA